ncbi:MAG: S23 ribosomal protein [Parcubacteria group bacterium GW2011_GWC2_44_17]|nr:MAG: S23 ribosomal protein [Parcubacteria group bacterium GW2011_GWC2_44_17]KKT49399.1 MAG: S23 ribosomal protein [Parcubacteria group bacterium GW2011_GWF2_44_17]
MKIESYENLIVWQKSMDLVIAIYTVTGKFPKEEIYGLTSQMRRAAVSIPSNIAEGSRRSSRKDFRNFLLNAFGSGAELETQIRIARRLVYGEDKNYIRAEALLSEVMRMLNKLTHELNE